MTELIIKIKDKSEMNFVQDFLKRMKIESKILSPDEKDDFDMGKRMRLSRKSGKGDKARVLEFLNKNS